MEPFQRADLTAYRERVARASASLRAMAAGAPPRLDKHSSNLFRAREAGPAQRLDLRDFNHVLGIDAEASWVDVEGLVPYEALVAATLPLGLMPQVVPQLKTITAGGAVVGVGIEATSFRHGLVHDTLLEADVLLASGEVVTCRPDNEHRDLFFGLANSYGTLGYALRLRLRLQPVRRFVRVEHRRFGAAAEAFAALDRACDSDADFVDGVAFGADDLVLNLGRFVDAAPHCSDYTGPGMSQIYYRSLRDKPLDHLTVADYLWRWDTDWFWCSKNFGAQHPLLRRLFGRRHLNSRTYTRLMRLNARWALSQRLERWTGRAGESVVQDVDIPIGRAAEFLDFLLREIRITPIWLCPIRPAEAAADFTLYPLAPGVRYVNFGFWDRVERPPGADPTTLNRRVEQQVLTLGGIKSLYSDSFFTPAEFAAAYRMDRYAALKARYDPGRRLLGLYEKCVLRA
jgi:FAD/FMN-containing dehydrogenase